MSDIFEKVRKFTRADGIENTPLFPYFRAIEENEGPTVKMDGKKVIMAGSNNYHGLSQDERVKEAAIQAIRKYGVSNNGCRLHNGTLDLHEKLEEKLARFLGKEAALSFTTGYQTNQGTMVPLIGKNDIIFSDRDNHNSIVQATLISRGMFLKKDQIVRYKHNDMNHLHHSLQKAPENAGKLIVSDGVFSMSGTIVDLPHMIDVAKSAGARIMLDDAHAIGVIGKQGRGTANYYGLDDEVDIIVGTFSKSLGSIGGFVAGSKEFIQYLKYTSPAHIFSASLPPAQAAAALCALDILISEPERIDKLQSLAMMLRKGLQSLGYEISDGIIPIIPVILGDDMRVFQTWATLMEEGIYTNAAVSPGVPEGHQLLRLCLMSTHDEEHVERILEAFSKVRKFAPPEIVGASFR